ncbi:hypothetical protein O6H91_06G066600 [Diphasiastrum complanatum]|uniref:Uncharacterized protein n=1 Tax=Diphasiastrum complanatum TaxID=34168 RepID=A0ACC2DEV8_DIPCM|nr:hypothetical protein O6H91_06G066600 [Diphasiastrum complanatum]
MALALAHKSMILTTLIALLGGAVMVHGSHRKLSTSDNVVTESGVFPSNGDFFTFTGFRGGLSPAPGETAFKTAFVTDFPALLDLGISCSLMYFQPQGVLAPHYHPQGSKLIYVMEGTLTVGFIDSGIKLINQTLQAGDVFVVPRGHIHFMVNFNHTQEAKVIFSFSNSNPGKIDLPSNILGAGIPQFVLEKSFSYYKDEIQQILGGPPANSN